MKINFPLWLTVVAALCLTACSRQTDSVSRSRVESPRSAERAGLLHRAVYRFSVVPGGVYSSEELRRARSIDPVVAEHYAAIGPNAVRMQLPKAASMYVSYRVQDKIYWTSQKRRIPQGEPVLSDGTNLVRTRCGNRLSRVPMTPTKLRNEPPDITFNTPEPPLTLNFTSSLYPLLEPMPEVDVPGDLFQGNLSYIPASLLTAPPNLPPGSNRVTTLSGPKPVFWPPIPFIPGDIGGVSVGTPGPRSALVAIPEPGAGPLFLAGLILAGFLWKRLRLATSLPTISLED